MLSFFFFQFGEKLVMWCSFSEVPGRQSHSWSPLYSIWLWCLTAPVELHTENVLLTAFTRTAVARLWLSFERLLRNQILLEQKQDTVASIHLISDTNRIAVQPQPRDESAHQTWPLHLPLLLDLIVMTLFHQLHIFTFAPLFYPVTVTC